VRPLRLAIEGFTAFRDRQEIDFEPLDLFVIRGPTGAGKTSILDAMVFALYGRVPRLGSAHGTPDFVSLGKVEARVSFDFSVDGKGRYRVARRLSTRTAQSATLERLDGDTWVSACERGGVKECNRVLQELLLLDYDSFCKAVVLPQGEFHRFLKGEANERRQVLVSLLGIGYFQRMGEIARARRTRLGAGVERTEEILAEQYVDATPERADELRRAAGSAADRFAALTSAVADAQEQAEEAVAHDAAVRTLVNHAAEFEELVDGLRAEVETCRAAEQAKTVAAAALVEAADRVEAARAAFAEADATVMALEAEVGTLDRLGEVAAATTTLRAAAADEDQATARCAKTEREHAAAERAAGEAESRDRESARLVADAQAAEQEAGEKAQTAMEHARELSAARDAAERRENELESARNRLATARRAAASARGEAVRQRDALAEALARLEEHRRQHAVAELARDLGPGAPCPVCEVPLAAAVAVAPDVKERLERAHAEERAARSRADAANEQSARAAVEVEAAEARVAELELEVAEALAGRASVAARRAEAESALRAGQSAQQELAQRRTARERVEAEAAAVHERLLEARDELTRRQALAEAARVALASARDRRATAEHLVKEHFGGKLPDDGGEQVAAQRTRLLAALDRARVARKHLDEANRSHAAAHADVAHADQRLAEVDLTLTRLRTRAEAAARASAQVLGDALPELPAEAAARDATATELAAWCDIAADRIRAECESITRARDAGREEVVKIAAGHGIDQPVAEQALALLRDAERTASTAAERAQNAAKEAARRAQERADMEARVAREREDIAVLGELASELRGDRFVEYIVEETLSLLAARASDELLRISDGRYSLVPGEGDFVVVDHVNADERRSVKTLSGGETFLASLALALALSRHVGELATEGLGAQLEAVFIDEGFGSLDPETLEEVIDALERLRAENLIVGVISHVPALAERVQAGVEVRKEQGGSRIVQSRVA
jgi:exonuclease SbcC